MRNVRRILLIDDADDIREVAQMCLELVGGYAVETASSGREGLSAARTNPPDAILLDVMMPGLDGLGTLEHLRYHPATKTVPVVLLTAKAQKSDRLRFAQLGVAGVLIKPFDPILFPRQVAEALGWQR